jgi:hypothetical protein
MKLTKQNMRAVEADFAAAFAEGKTDVIEFDDTLKRFGLRARASGRRSWIIQYEKWGRSRRVILGNAAVVTPEQARHLTADAPGTVKSRGGEGQKSEAALSLHGQAQQPELAGTIAVIRPSSKIPEPPI